jgi:hypothetical protein
MSEFKLERADDEEQKSVVELEQELLDKKEEQDAAVVHEEKTEDVIVDTPTDTPQGIEVDDDVVLSHIRTKYGREVTSMDELLQARQPSEEDDLPEDLKAYKKYRKETGRSFEDFKSLNRDFDQEDPERLVREYTKMSNPELDDSDIEFLMGKLKAGEFDDDDDARVKSLEFKKELKKAKDFFNGQKEQYKVPLESSAAFVPESEKEDYQSFKQYKKTLEETQAVDQQRSKVFTEKTNSLFSENFEGFEVKLGDQVMKYKPAETATLREQQSNLMNFVGKFLDENGALKDEKGFHKAIAAANDVDKIATWAYEAGIAAEIERQSRDAKNIDMSKKPQQGIPKSGLTFEAERDDNVHELRMKTRTKN